jgi:hypothetical protein
LALGYILSRLFLEQRSSERLRTIASANGAAQFPKSLSAASSIHLLPANRSTEFSSGIPVVRAKAWGRNSMDVLGGIELERAFSALTSPVR